jgi:hypothetical protein
MITFLQFLDEKQKITKVYGIGTGHSPGMAFKAIKPANPAKIGYRSLNFGKRVSGVVGK